MFSSQRYDESTKNYHFINREYDSYTGRWLTPDPLGFEDGCNLYAYVHNNPLIYTDPYGLWGESVKESWGRAKEFGRSFSRGFADDASFGATTYAMGEHQTPSFNSKTAYYTGTACSLGTGLFYGSTWIKGAMYGGKLLNYGCRIAKTAMTATKTLKQTCTVVKTVANHTPVKQIAQKALNVGASAAKEGAIELSQNVCNGYSGKSGWELFNKLYQPLRNSPAKINNYNYTGHALDQMQNRGFMPSVVENTIKNGLVFSSKADTIGFFDPINKVRVITDTTAKKIITVIGGAP